MNAPSEASTPKPPAKRRKRWGRIVVILLLIAATIFAFLPNLIALTPLREAIVAKLLQKPKGKVIVKSAELSWWSPIVLHELSIVDEEGQPFFFAQKVSNEKTVYDLLIGDPTDRGTFLVEQPRIDLITKGEHFNLFRIYGHVIFPNKDPSAAASPNPNDAAPPPAPAKKEKAPEFLEVVLQNGSVHISDLSHDRKWVINNLSVTARDPGLRPEPMIIKVSGDSTDGGGPWGFALNAQLPPRQEKTRTVTLEAMASDVPLPMLGNFLRPIDPTLQLGGVINADLNGSLTAGDNPLAGEGELTLNVKGSNVTARSGTDEAKTLLLGTIDGSLKVTEKDGLVRLEPRLWQCDLGSAELSGQLDLRGTTAQILDSLQLDFLVQADAKTLAQQFPDMLGRANILGGIAFVELKTNTLEGAKVLRGRAGTRDISGVSETGRFNLRGEMALQFDLRRTDDGRLMVDLLNNRSEPVLSITGNLSNQKFTLDGKWDFSRLNAFVANLPFIPLMDLSGQGEMRIVLRQETDRGAIEDCTIQMTNFAFRSPEWNIVEPRIEIATSGTWNTGARTLELEKTWIEAASSFAVIAPKVVIQSPPGGRLSVNADLQLGADLGHLASYRVPQPGTTPSRVVGHLKGNAKVSTTGPQIRGKGEMQIEPLQIWEGNESVLNEPSVTFVADGLWEPATGKLSLDQLAVQSGLISLQSQGSVAKKQGQQLLELAGTLNYDPAKVAALVEQRFKGRVRFESNPQQKFTLLGQLGNAQGAQGRLPSNPNSPLSQWTGATDFGWKSAYLMGFNVGPGNSRAVLKEGWVRVDPIRCEINQGRFNLQPSLRLEPTPKLVRLEPGVVLDRVQVTPDVANQLLVYVMPILAGASNVDGTLSLRIRECEIPLDNPYATSLSADLAIDKLDVGPGPLVEQIAQMLGVPPKVTIAENSVIAFEFTKGRVVHRELRVLIADLAITINGSVGTDGTLDLVANVPVPPQLARTGPLGAIVANKSLKVPIRGTLQKPKVDMDQLRRENVKTIEKTANELLREILKP